MSEENTYYVDSVTAAMHNLKLDGMFTITFNNRDEAIRRLCQKVFGANPVYSEDCHTDTVKEDLLTSARRELAETKDQLETERIRLAACGVIAMADTENSRDTARDMLPIYRSGSLSDVIRRVDECIELRKQRDEWEAENAKLQSIVDKQNVLIAEAIKQRDTLAAHLGRVLYPYDESGHSKNSIMEARKALATIEKPTP